MANFQEKVTFIWDLADLLRGVYKRNEYQKVILPFTVLKRFDSVLSDSKNKVLEEYNKYKKEFENMEHVLGDSATDKKGNALGFYNYSKYDFKTLLEDTAEHYRLQQNIYNFLLRKKGYETEDYFFLLFYVPREVTESGEVIFDTELVKMKVDVKMAEKAWKDALKLLEGECPNKCCEWCEGR